MGKLTDKVAKGVFWVLMEKFGIQAVHFVVTLVLARLLTPNDYGTVALLSIFIQISNVFVDCGFGKALVQKKKATQTDMNSVFFLSVAIALVLYAVLFVAAPWVADFYRIPELTVMMRVLAVSLIFHSVNGVQNVELNRKMLFKLSFRISWARAVVSAVTGISLAYVGYGPWSLVWASLFGGVTGVIARQLVIRWRPTLTVSRQSIRGLFGFGWKLLAAALVDAIYSNLQGLLIGKFYSRADLAFVNKGRHIPHMSSNLVTDTLRRVAFPALSSLQDDHVRLRNAMRRMIRVSTFLVFPFMIFLAVLAHPIIELLFGERWLPAVPYFQLMSVSVMLRQLDVVNRQALMARGRSDLTLWLTIGRRVLCLIIMLCTLRLGVFLFFASVALTVVPLGFFMNAIPNQIQLGYTIKMQLHDISRSLILSLLVGGMLFATTMLPFPVLWMLPFQTVFAIGTYMGLSVIVCQEPLGEIASALLPTAQRKMKADSIVLSALRHFAEKVKS